MSQTVAQQADLIWLVVAGEINPKKRVKDSVGVYCKRPQKPLQSGIPTKTDLYTRSGRQAVYDTLDQAQTKTWLRS